MSAAGMRRFLGAVTLGAFLIAAFTPLSNALNRRLSVKPDLRDGDAIVVLGSGANSALSERSIVHTLHGIDLWRHGRAPIVLFSGPATSAGPSEANMRRELARRLGVLEERILIDSAGQTTRGEAQSVRRVLQQRGAQRILLVTDARHLRRARESFERAGFDVIPAPPPDGLASAASPQARLQLTRRIVEETLARIYYWTTGLG